MYFTEFPVLPYPFYVADKRYTAAARNIIRRVALSDSVKAQSVFIEYDVKDGERPEHISDKIYGSPNYHWLVLLSNEIIDPYHDWYKSQTVLEQYIQKKYTGNVVYFTDRSSGFTCDVEFLSGCTLEQSGKSEPITGYRDTFCEFVVETPHFSEGNAVVEKSSGATVGIYIHKVAASQNGVHHFTIQRPTGTDDGYNGAQEQPIIDPLAYQSADYEGYETVLGNQVPSSSLYGVTGATVQMWETYIGKYMGISGSEVTLYSVSNQVYETEENEKRRTVRILSPAYLSQATRELKAALGV